MSVYYFNEVIIISLKNKNAIALYILKQNYLQGLFDLIGLWCTLIIRT